MHPATERAIGAVVALTVLAIVIIAATIANKP